MMKLLLHYKFTFMVFMTLPLIFCSNNDDDTDEQGQVLSEPIIISVTENFLTDCNQTVTIDNVDITYREQSMEEGGFNDSQGPCIFDSFNPVSSDISSPGLGEFDNTPSVFLGSFLEIDFSRIQNISQVTVTIADFCAIGCTEVKLYNNQQLLETIDNQTISEIEEITFDELENANRLTLVSFEGFFYQIKFE